MTEKEKEKAPQFVCPHCQMGTLQPTAVVFAHWFEGQFITVPDFPAWVCDFCGAREYDALAADIRAVASAVFAERGVKVPYLIGTMIELPRACIVADEIGEAAEFFSFGTNDLTQMAYGLSRDDSAKFLGDYLRRAIYKKDPFQELDERGVGGLMQIGIERGRRKNRQLKIGICGEHGGDPASIHICHRLGLDYVSCSPYRIPVARLAAAQAAIEERRGGPAFKDI